MARIFITGSADGLGQLAAKALVDQRHDVVLHARTEQRGRDALAKVPGAGMVVTADLSDIEETKQLAKKVNALGSFDAVIHNAAVYDASGGEIFTVNVLAPYILTALMQKPERLIFLSSDMHKGGQAKMDAIESSANRITYSDSKLHVLMLAKAIARRWPDVYSNAVNPGWVPTKMGGRNAPDSFESGYETQVWLAITDDASAKVSGRYFYHRKESPYNTQADDEQSQEQLLTLLDDATGIGLPR